MHKVDLGLEDAVAWYARDFLGADVADSLFDEFRYSLDWRQESIRIMGRSVPQPRLTCWYGDPGMTYTYSGLTLEPRPWTPALAQLRRRVERAVNATFPAVLGNLYRDENDSVGWHADNEPELGPQPVIASVSLGATRRFELRRRDDHAVRHVLDLEHGSLLALDGPVQHHWQHHVPKGRKPAAVRINLTFRTHEHGTAVTSRRPSAAP